MVTAPGRGALVSACSSCCVAEIVHGATVYLLHVVMGAISTPYLKRMHGLCRARNDWDRCVSHS
eukprot:6924680-Pyramimonas_sp.AAC.1